MKLAAFFVDCLSHVTLSRMTFKIRRQVETASSGASDKASVSACGAARLKPAAARSVYTSGDKVSVNCG